MPREKWVPGPPIGFLSFFSAFIVDKPTDYVI